MSNNKIDITFEYPWILIEITIKGNISNQPVQFSPYRNNKDIFTKIYDPFLLAIVGSFHKTCICQDIQII